jgi:hypothetical protein
MAPSSNWRRAQHWAVEKTVVTSATIKLFLPLGDAKSLRTAEISNWTGKAVAAPRTELDELLAREELEKAGIYILSGNDPVTNAPLAYIGEAEIIRDRLKQHTRGRLTDLRSNRIRPGDRGCPNRIAMTWKCSWLAFGSYSPYSAPTSSCRSPTPRRNPNPGGVIFCRIKGAEARGQRTPNGFVVFQDSTAVLEQRPSAETYPWAVV